MQMNSTSKLINFMFPALRKIQDEYENISKNTLSLSDEVGMLREENICLRTEIEKIETGSDWIRGQLSHLDQRYQQSESNFRDIQNNFKEIQAQIAKENTAKRLYIVGYARSGTTVLMDIINSSVDAFIFSELNIHVLRKFPDIFSDYVGNNFVKHFNERKRRELALRYKGAYAAGLQMEEKQSFQTPDQFIDYIGRRYIYVGDKIATTDRDFREVKDTIFLKYFLEQEADALCLFTFRRPSENLLSITKMFPNTDLKRWGKSLAETIAVILISFMRGNRSYLIFHEDIGPSLIGELSELLDINLMISHSLIGGGYQTTYDKTDILKESWVAELDACYDNMHEIYQCDKGIIKCSKTDGLAKKLAIILESVKAVLAQLSDEPNAVMASFFENDTTY